MSQASELDGDDEVEEVRELLYDIVKNAGPRGVETAQLAREYERQFVQTGLGRPLPAAWLRYVKVADEFDMRLDGDKTFVSVISRDSVSNVEKVASIVREAFVADEEDIVEQDVTLKALPLSGMPAGKTKVHILAATDPFDISVRLSSWDPMPDYLYSALSKDFSDETRKKKRILPKEGRVCVAKLPGGSWERVQLVKPSATMGHQGYWVVFAVDVGVYHLAHEKNLQPLSSSVLAFDKVLLAKCQLDGVQPVNGTRIWSRNAQQAFNAWLSEVQGTEAELQPTSEWSMTEGPRQVPCVTARLVVNGEDLAQKLADNGYANKV